MIKVERKELKILLSHFSYITDKLIPNVLSYIRLTVENGILKIAGSDGSTTLFAEITAKIDNQDFAALVPASKFRSIISKLSGDIVDLGLDGNSLVISDGTSILKIPFVEVDRWLAIAPPDVTKIPLVQFDFTSIKFIQSILTNTDQEFTSAVVFTEAGVVATDRLTITTIQTPQINIDAAIGQGGFATLCKIGMVERLGTISNNRLVAVGKDIPIVAVIETPIINLPDYEAVIPDQSQVVVQTNDIDLSLLAQGLVINSTADLTFDPDKDEVHIVIKDIQEGVFETTISTPVTGVKVKIRVDINTLSRVPNGKLTVYNNGRFNLLGLHFEDVGLYTLEKF